jgi:hypothetical protein
LPSGSARTTPRAEPYQPVDLLVQRPVAGVQVEVDARELLGRALADVHRDGRAAGTGRRLDHDPVVARVPRRAAHVAQRLHPEPAGAVRVVHAQGYPVDRGHAPDRIDATRIRCVSMFFVVLRRTGPEWDRALPMEKQSRWPEHAAFMDGLVDAGLVRLGGPLADERRVVLICESDSADAVRDALARDPWSGSHLVVDGVDPWTIRLNGLPGLRA